MKIGIISDTHDHLKNIRKVIEKLKEHKVKAVIHCGDFCAPFSLIMLKELEVSLHGVFGNVDGDKLSLIQKKPESVNIYGEFGEIKLEGRKIAFVHYPYIAEALAHTEKYDLICHGHTHRVRIERIKNSTIVNPGEITEFLGKPSYAIYDTNTNDVKIENL